MKKSKAAITLLLTLALLCFGGTLAYAKSLPALVDSPTAAISSEISSGGESMEPLPQVIDVTPDASEPSPAAGPEDESEAAQSQAETAPTTAGGGNTPYFIGAVIAVLVFAGVACYCKFNGNN